MSLYRHPEPAIDAWLADGPASLSSDATAAIKATARLTPQRSRLVVVPVMRVTTSRRVLLIAAVLALIAAGLAAMAGIRLPADKIVSPTTSPAPLASADDPIPTEGDLGSSAIIRGAAWTQLLAYSVPSNWDVDIRATLPNPGDGVTARGVAFTRGGIGPYGLGPGGVAESAPPDARGIVVAEVTGATAHDPVPVGIDSARRFLERLGEVSYFKFTVGPITETELAGFPALAADVQSGHLDRVAEMDFALPSRILVADVNGGILVVQIWGASADTLQAWLPEAMSFISTFRLGRSNAATCWSAPPVPVELGPSGLITLPGTAIGIEYTIPAGRTLWAETQPGVLGIAEGGSGLSYDSGPTSAGRGIVIGEAKSAQPHSGGATLQTPFGTDARSILEGLARLGQLDIQPAADIEGPGGLPAHGASISLRQGIGNLWPHIDRLTLDGRDCLVDFSRPNATYFVDAGGEVVVFQVWAMSNDDLARWLPEAKALIRSMRIVVDTPTG